MTEWQPSSERERAVASVTECGHILWKAQERALRADETLRRAIRVVDEAKEALGDAARRLERIDAAAARAGPAGAVQQVPNASPGSLRLLA